MTILIAGELNPDLILRNYRSFPQPGKEVLVEDVELTLGSSSAICAVGLARLGNTVAFAANVGNDIYGDYCISVLQREGIDVSLIRRGPELKTGITVSLTSPRDRALVTYPGAVASLHAEELAENIFVGRRHFHVSAYFLQEGLRSGLCDLFARVRRMGLTTSLDTGYDPSENWSSEELTKTLRHVDVFFPNEVEIRGITGRGDVWEGLRALDNGHTLVVGKLGAQGCICRNQERSLVVPAFPVEVVDTTGAGDSFNAGFLHKWLRNCPIEDCLRFAAACGALSTQGLGGVATQPTEAEAERFLQLQTRP